MNWLNGVSECWLLSSTCSIHWEAWAAIGSLAAVLAALGIALSRYHQARKDALRRARAMGGSCCYFFLPPEETTLMVTVAVELFPSGSVMM